MTRSFGLPSALSKRKKIDPAQARVWRRPTLGRRFDFVLSAGIESGVRVAPPRSPSHDPGSRERRARRSNAAPARLLSLSAQALSDPRGIRFALVLSAGIEPTSVPSEGTILSIERREDHGIVAQKLFAFLSHAYSRARESRDPTSASSRLRSCKSAPHFFTPRRGPSYPLNDERCVDTLTWLPYRIHLLAAC